MGPEVDSREVIYTATSTQYGLSIGIGLVLLYLCFRMKQQHRLFLPTFCTALVVLVTSPWIAMFNDAVIGAYPTVDKEGSLLFYLDGVHWRALLSPIESLNDPAYRLIGFHLGHLWIVELFDLFLEPFAAYNAQMLLNLVLNCLISTLFFREMVSSGRGFWNAVTLGCIFGMQLHVFRDIHWYTIEKSALYAFMGFWLVLHRIYLGRSQRWWLLGPIYFAATWLNFYWGILLLFLGAWYCTESTVWKRNSTWQIRKALLGCVPFGLLIAVVQMALMQNGAAFASETDFATRAALDSVTVWPPDWNRMGFWRPLNPIVLMLFALAIARRQVSVLYTGIIVIFTSLSLGPQLTDSVVNPVYALFSMMPGLWRFAKPEVFFLVSYAAMCACVVRMTWKNWWFPLLIALWLAGLYTSEAFPYLSTFVSSALSPNWSTVFD